MRHFDYSQLTKRTWNNEIVSLLTKIHEYRGQQEQYLSQKPVELKRLVQIAQIQSTEASNRIEGIRTTNARLQKLVADKTTPENRDEEEIMGYRNVLRLIHENYRNIPVHPNFILQMHRDLLQYTPLSYGGRFKTVPNEIDIVFPDGKKQVLFQPLAPYEMPDAVSKICESYRIEIEKEEIDPLLLIPAFLLDFLCIHPFNDGNGRMSRLLTLLCLYRSGYRAGQFISIEKEIGETRENYYSSLDASNQGWHTENNDPKYFITYMLQIILSCYKKLDDRLSIEKTAGIRSTSYDIVRKNAESRLGSFSKRDILESCPQLGSSSVEAALKRLVLEGVIIRTGQGRKTRYSQHPNGMQ